MEKIIQVSSICPEGYEIDKERSTFEKIVFKPKKESYEDVYRKLFYGKKAYYFDKYGKIEDTTLYESGYKNLNNCTSEKQAKKLLAINQLLNVAKYLNGDWQPDWNSPAVKYKYFIYMEPLNDKLYITFSTRYISSFIYFKAKELAQKAIDILGEKTIKLALSTDW